MKNKLLACLMAISLFTTSGLIVFAENEPETAKDSADTAQTDVITTGTQERAQENVVDVDADIEDDIAASVPRPWFPADYRCGNPCHSHPQRRIYTNNP